jgi:two-component system sensor histidine kinase CpxA
VKLLRGSLYAKIFLWFCLTIAVSTALVLLVAGITGSQPFGQRFVAVTQDLYARTAVDLYSTGGAPALRRYLDVLARNSGIEGHLLVLPQTVVGVLGEPVPPQDARVLLQASRSGRSAMHFDRHFWTAASFVAGPAGGGGDYLFLLSAHPLRGLLDGTFFQLAAPRLAAGLLLVAFFCLLLARHITQPVRVLQAAATRMAGGDLAVRTLPSLAGRSDELASMAAAFDSMAERLEALLQTQRQMLADISHELRSPLTRVGVSLELLRRGQHDVVESMQADLDRLNLMIGQILELARFDLQPPSRARTALDLRSLLDEVVDAANYEGRTLRRSVRLAASASLPFTGDEAALRSCMENVIRNALHHAPAETAVEVTLERLPGGHALVKVEDSGPGVPQEYLQQIFTPFFRVPGSQSAHPHGSGLGLSISARVVAGCGGVIGAANRSPSGLCVSILLPVAPRPL